MTPVWAGAGGHPGDGLHRGDCGPGRRLPARDPGVQTAGHPAGGRAAGHQGALVSQLGIRRSSGSHGSLSIGHYGYYVVRDKDRIF